MTQPSPAPNGSRPRLGELLIREGLLTAEQLAKGLEEQKSFGGRLGRHLVDLGFISDAILLEALSRQLRIPKIDLDAPGVVAPDAGRYARADLAEQWGFCPVAFDARRNVLVIAVSDPDVQLLADIEGFLAMRVEPRIATAEAVERTSRRLFHGDGAPVKRMAGLQVARGEQKNLGGPSMSDALGPANTMPPQAAPTQPALPAVSPNPYEAQLAQQVAMQQQIQQQIQQQLRMQQMQQIQAQQAAAQAQALQAQQQAAAQAQAMQAQQHAAAQAQAQAQAMQAQAMQAQAMQAQALQAQALQAQQAAAQAQPFNPAAHVSSPSGATLPPVPAPPMGYPRPPPPLYPAFSTPPGLPKPPPNPQGPPNPAMGPASFEELQDQLARLEKTLAAQARALRALVEVLVDKGVLSKVEMARKQQTALK